VSFLPHEIIGSIVQDLDTLKIQNNASKSLNEEADAILTVVTKTSKLDFQQEMHLRSNLNSNGRKSKSSIKSSK
jgi:hypothetical protein